jgi:hypothetical protein
MLSTVHLAQGGKLGMDAGEHGCRFAISRIACRRD